MTTTTGTHRFSPSPRRLVLVVVGAALALTRCGFAGADAPSPPEVVAWTATVSGPIYTGPTAIPALPAVAVTSREDATLRMISATGQELWRWSAPGTLTAAPAAADVDLDGRLEFFCADRKGGLACLGSDGALRWKRNLGAAVEWSAVTLADVDGDGFRESVVADVRGHVTCTDAWGERRWTYVADAKTNAPLAAGDLDGDGRAEVVVPVSNGAVVCLADGAVVRWTFRAGGACYSGPVLADVDGDDRLEVLVGANDKRLYCLDAAGRERWHLDATGTVESAIAVADLEGDGRVEIVFAAGDGTIACADGAGRVRWQATVGDVDMPGGLDCAPAIADLDADGRQEVIVAGSDYWLHVLSSDGKGVFKRRCGSEVMGAPAVLPGADGPVVVANCYCSEVIALRVPGSRPGGVVAWPSWRRDAALTGGVAVAEGLPGVSARLTSWGRQSPGESVGYIELTNHGQAPADLEYVVTTGGSVQPMEHTGRLRVEADGVARLPFWWEAITTPSPQPQAVVLRAWEISSPRRIKSFVFARPTGAPVAAEHADVAAVPPLIAAPLNLTPPTRWRPPVVGGRAFWHMSAFQPEVWREYGIADEPFIADSAHRIDELYTAPLDSAFPPGSPQLEALARPPKPVFVTNDFWTPQHRLRPADGRRLQELFGKRYMGLLLWEWIYGLTHRWPADDLPRTRAEAAARCRAFFRLMMQETGRVTSAQGYWLQHHMAAKEGSHAIFAEIGENIPLTNMQMAFLSGTARQYGLAWGVDISTWLLGAVTRFDLETPDTLRARPSAFSGAHAGHSQSLINRMLYAAYARGATFLQIESDAVFKSAFVTHYKGQPVTLSPIGRDVKRWYEFLRRHPDRGVPWTPVAIVLDPDHGWSPSDDLIWHVFPRERADRELDALFNVIYPWNAARQDEQFFLVNGPLGDRFDVVTTDAQSPALSAYRALYLAGGIKVEAAVAQRLRDYVKQGGLLVLNVEHLGPGCDADFLGVEVADGEIGADACRCVRDGASWTTTEFPLRRLALRGASVLLAAGDAPVATMHRYGAGTVVVTAIPHMLDRQDQATPMIRHLLAHLAAQTAPVTVKGDVEYILARRAGGWWVTLINNKGVYKTATTIERVVPSDAARVEIVCAGRVAEMRELTAERKVDWRRDGAYARTQLTVPAGEVRVLEINE